MGLLTPLRRWRLVDWLLTRWESYWALLDQLGLAPYAEVVVRFAVAAVLGGWTYMSVEALPVAIACAIVVFAALMSTSAVRTLVAKQAAAAGSDRMPSSQTEGRPPIADPLGDLPAIKPEGAIAHGGALPSDRLSSGEQDVVSDLLHDVEAHGEKLAGLLSRVERLESSPPGHASDLPELPRLLLLLTWAEIHAIQARNVSELMQRAPSEIAETDRGNLDKLEYFSHETTKYLDDVQRMAFEWQLPDANRLEISMRIATTGAERSFEARDDLPNGDKRTFSVLRRAEINLAKLKLAKKYLHNMKCWSEIERAGKLRT